MDFGVDGGGGDAIKMDLRGKEYQLDYTLRDTVSSM
jgi:hypothetical protein